MTTFPNEEKKPKKIKSPFTDEQSALMELANKYNALHKDVMRMLAALESIPITKNILMAVARKVISSKDLAKNIMEKAVNTKYEEITAEELRKLVGKKVKTFNKQLIKKSK
jgi:predicted phosphoribosyltransferase